MEPVAFKTTAQVTEEAVNYIKQRKNHSIQPLKSRWQKFNRVTCGGIEPNMIFTIAGSSGSGKYSSSCLKFSNDFLSVLQEQLPIEYDNCLYRRPTENVFELVFNSKRGAYISSILYNGATVYLKRKFEKHEELCRLYKGLYRVLPSKYGENCEVNPVVSNWIAKG